MMIFKLYRKKYKEWNNNFFCKVFEVPDRKFHHFLIWDRFLSNTIMLINPLSASPTKWSNTLKQFVDFCPRILWLCLTILWGWRVKDKMFPLLQVLQECVIFLKYLSVVWFDAIKAEWKRKLLLREHCFREHTGSTPWIKFFIR